jgi:hypothetical protein
VVTVIRCRPAVEIRLALARIERGRDNGAAARDLLEGAVQQLRAAPATAGRDRLLARASTGGWVVVEDFHLAAAADEMLARYFSPAEEVDLLRR